MGFNVADIYKDKLWNLFHNTNIQKFASFLEFVNDVTLSLSDVFQPINNDRQHDSAVLHLPN